LVYPFLFPIAFDLKLPAPNARECPRTMVRGIFHARKMSIVCSSLANPRSKLLGCARCPCLKIIGFKKNYCKPKKTLLPPPLSSILFFGFYPGFLINLIFKWKKIILAQN
jgi:hypothetical protein